MGKTATKRRAPKKRWLKRELLRRIELDKPGYSLKVFRITWLDGSQCIQIMKYAIQPVRGTDAPYSPPQYVQVPVPIWEQVVEAVAASMSGLCEAESKVS